MQEERVLHEAKLAKMEAEMKMVFQQKVQEKEAKLKQSEEELYARHKEMKDSLEKQRADLEEKKRRIESGRPITPDKNAVCVFFFRRLHSGTHIVHRLAGGRVSCGTESRSHSRHSLLATECYPCCGRFLLFLCLLLLDTWHLDLTLLCADILDLLFLFHISTAV
jgi:hypothetical protein